MTESGDIQGTAKSAAAIERSAEARALDRFAEIASQIFWETDADGRVTFVSRTLEQFTQTSADMLLGHPMWEIWQELAPDHSGHALLEQSFLARKPYGDLRLKFCFDDGRVFYLSNFGAPVYDSENTFIGFRCVSGDVTALVEAEEQIQRQALVMRESEARLRSTMEGSLDGVYFHKVVRNDQGEIVDFEFEDASQRGLDMVTLSREELIGSRLSETYPDAFENGLFDKLKKVLETGEVLDEDMPALENVDAQWLHHQIVPYGDGVAFTVRDITERKASETQLRRSEERLVGAHRIARLGHWEFNTATQRFTAYGEMFADLDYGGEKSEFSFEDALRPIHPEDVERVREAFRRSFTEGVPYDETDRVVYDDGQIRHMRLIGEVFRDDAGAIVGMRGTTQDITELRTASEALRHSEQQLHQAQKMEAVGQLTGGIAHDFNNLLAVISANLELARLRVSSDGDVAKILEAGIAATERGAELTGRLLSFSRRQTLQPQPTDINELTKQMLHLASRTLGEAVEVVFEPSEGAWWAKVDPAQLENALLNLAINARDSMPDGGTLTIRTRNFASSDESAATSDALNPGDYVVVEVEDTGTGMSEDTLEKAFEPFFTTKEAGQGSGLGLSMVYGFAKQSGGHVEIDTTVGQGTVIRLSLPRAEKTKREAPEVQPETLEARSSGKTVLIVEDHPLVRELTVSLVESLGYAVLEAPDASAALDVIENGAQVDLLLSDVILGKGMNGVELANQVRETCANTKVLLMSGYAREAFTEEDGLGDSYELIAKPFRMADLAQRIEVLLN